MNSSNQITSFSGNMNTCSICIEDIQSNHEHLVLDCNHHFHHSCVSRALTTETSGMRCPNCRKDIVNLDKIKVYSFLSESEPHTAMWSHSLGICQLRENDEHERAVGLSNIIRSVEMDQTDPELWQSLGNYWPADKSALCLRLVSDEGKKHPVMIDRLYAFEQVIKLQPDNQFAQCWSRFLKNQK